MGEIREGERWEEAGFHLGISSWGGKLTDHVAVRPQRGEGGLHNDNE